MRNSEPLPWLSTRIIGHCVMPARLISVTELAGLELREGGTEIPPVLELAHLPPVARAARLDLAKSGQLLVGFPRPSQLP